MNPLTHNVNRRQLLRGTAVGLGSLALSPFADSPFANSMLALAKETASGKQPPRKRFVFCIKGNGLWADNLQPPSLLDDLPFKVEYDDAGRLVDGNNGSVRKGVMAAADKSLGGHITLNPIMESLQPFASRISILQGIDSGFSVYHKGCYQGLGAFAARRRDTAEAADITIDSLLAAAFPAPVPHVCLGHDPKSPSGVSYLDISAAGKDKPLPFFTKPLRAYKELFGVVAQGEGKQTYDVQSEILDFFVQDTELLRGTIAAAEREQLDRYLDAFASVQKSRQEVEAMTDRLTQFAPEPPPEIDLNRATEIGAANTEIAAAALCSGLTNVVTLVFDSLGNSSYPELGVGGLHGSVGHGQGGKVLEKRQKICRFHYEQIARLAKTLDAVPEGDGTMLDNTVIIYTSDNGETHHSSGVNWPMLVLGDLGGKLKRNRYFVPGNEQRDRSKPGYVRLGDIWATLLAASEQPYADFGRPLNGVAHKPVETLLA